MARGPAGEGSDSEAVVEEREAGWDPVGLTPGLQDLALG